MKNAKNRFIAAIATMAILFSLVVPVSAAANTNYTLTGNQAEDIVRVAMAQKGQTKSQLGYKNDWCAYFVCWAGRTAGADFPQSDLGYPVDIARWFVNNGKGTFYCFRDGNYNDIIKRGVTQPNNIVRTTRESFAPKKGDLICYLWSYHVGTYNWSHIGIVTADYTGNGLVSTVEGNVGNRVGTFNQRYNSEVIGIIRPNYSNNSASSNLGVTLTLNSSSYELKPGEQATINLTFTGAADIVDCSFSDNSICEYAGGGWNPGQHNGFMSFKAKSPGTATVTVFLKDKNKKVLASKAITVTVKSTTTLSADTSNITLDLASKKDQTITLTLGGDLPNNCALRISISNPDIVSNEWVNYTSGTVINARITGKLAGTATITYTVVDSNTQKVYATKAVTVTVKEPSYTVQYNANGGANAPASQTKTYQKSLTLSSTQPTRAGYTFSGWSTSPNGSVQYHPGDQYSVDKTLTLYAVWNLNSVTIDSDISNITLDLPGKSSQVITLTLGGPVENNCQLKTSTSNPGIATSNWDNYQSGTIVHAIITAKSAGTTTITYSLVDNNTQQTLATKRITVTVRANTEAVTFQGHSYQVFDASLTWEEAKAACAAKGGHLATITSQEEQDFVSNLLSSHSKFFYWIGASDARQEGTWEWVTGETWNYKNWLRGQPDNHSDLNGRTENYLAMERTSKGWNDLQNAGDSSGNSRLQNGGYICEWDY